MTIADQPAPPPDRAIRRTPRTALAALFLLVPVPTLGTLAAMHWESMRGTPLGQGIYVASKAWILLLPAAWWLLVERGRPSLSPARRGGLLVGAALGAAIGGAILATWAILGPTLVDPATVRDAALANGIGRPALFIAFAIYLCVMNAVLEEYVWRWFVFEQCRALASPKAAIAASALFFTAHHVVALRAQFGWPATLLASAGVFMGGAIWSWCYGRYRSIWPGAVSHLIVDVTILWIAWRLIFG